tara:strand:- start:212 stop:394 length:183 start_codon:yes stop_codon:yes gene_type:complete
MNTTELNKSEVRLLIKVLPYKTLRTLLTVELTPNLRRLVLKEYDWRDSINDPKPRHLVKK